jgi:ATP-dependent Clp protease ATP-binding subunit ClpA
LEVILFERFTDRARRVVVLAQEAAKGLGHNYLGTEHILLGVLREEDGIGAKVLIEAGVTAQKALEKITEMVPPGDAVIKGPIPFTPRAKKAIEMALREALQLGHNYIGTEHLLLGLIREGETAASELLSAEGIDIEVARKAILEKLEETIRKEESGEPSSVNPESEGSSEDDGDQPRVSRGLPGANKSKDALEMYAYDLTERARKGELDPVIGRSKEIDRAIETLARRTKNNPVLIGEPGVGKTAIVEGLAQAIVDGDAPKILKDKAIYTVDIPGMVAGAKYRGEFEERLKKLLAEVKKRKNVILFIDELHTLVGAGASEGSVDAANILKPILARGEIRTIGATTLDEYRKYVEKDAALERRFQPILVEPPTVEHAIKIMKGLREKYEEHHGIKITDEALVSTVVLSDRYLPDRFLPDKAIDLLDEASARLRLRSARESVDISGFLKELDEIREAKSVALLNEGIERLAELRVMEDEVLNAQRAAILAAETAAEEEGAPKPVLNSEDIAKVLASATGVPVSHLTSEETSRLLQMEDELHASLIGQDQAVKALSRAIRRTRAGLKDPKRPAGSFIFAGPSGVGKAQPLTSKILTPNGWLTMGDMEVGTVVTTPGDGKATVNGVFPQGERDVYQITFTDGRSVEASDEHLWRVWSHDHLDRKDIKKNKRGSWKIITTLQLLERVNAKTHNKLAVQLVKPISFSQKSTLPIPAYTMGALLGDGSFGHDIRITSIDEHILNRVGGELSEMNLVLSQHKNEAISYTIKSKTPLGYNQGVKGDTSSGVITNPLKRALDKMSLLGKRSWEKNIPESYKTASLADRKDLIQGLMDTDGYVSKSGVLIFYSTSEQLVDDFIEVIHSLGGVAKKRSKQTHYTYKGEKRAGRISFVVTIRFSNPAELVSLPRKLDRVSKNYQYAETLKNTIEKVEFLRRDIVQCIHLDNEEHLYITDGFVVTHNTELSKALAKFLFGDESSLITLDMSEYSEKHNVARLFGAPPGYVGYEEGGQLTERVRRKPFSVILFDEIEKAHPDVFNSLLQVLDEGRLTDSQGRSIDFKNTVIIMTTNLGSREIGKGQSLGFHVGSDSKSNYERMQNTVAEELKKQFRPEFLNRIDETIVFHQLDQSDIIKITDLMIEGLNQRLSDRKMAIELTEAAKIQIATIGYDPVLGARPLRRAIQREIEDTLSEKILFGDILAGETAHVDFIDGAFVFAGVGSIEAVEESSVKAPKPKKSENKDAQPAHE